MPECVYKVRKGDRGGGEMASRMASKDIITLRGSAAIINEFFGYAANSILYNRRVYPEETFAKVKKYGLTMLLTQGKGVKAFIASITSQLSASFPSRSPSPPQFMHWLQIVVCSPCCLCIDLLCG